MFCWHGIKVNLNKSKMENKCYVISREQVSNELGIEMAHSVGEARELQRENRMRYIDSVYLTLGDLSVLSKMVEDNEVFGD